MAKSVATARWRRCRLPLPPHQVKARRIETMHGMEEGMLTLDQCIGMSGLDDDEIAVIAEHRRLPTIVAVEVGQTLLETVSGKFILRGYISDLLANAKRAGRHEKAQHLDRVLTGFDRRYPTPPGLRR